MNIPETVLAANAKQVILKRLSGHAPVSDPLD
jgi:hypothetical protein